MQSKEEMDNFINVYSYHKQKIINYLLGYECDKVIPTLLDVIGRTLQQFIISSRTVPIDFTFVRIKIILETLKMKLLN